MTNNTAMYHRTPKKAKIPERKVEKRLKLAHVHQKEKKQTEIEIAPIFFSLAFVSFCCISFGVSV
jgi:hypothetical protein